MSKYTDNRCPDNHKHGFNRTCYSVHKCRCEGCIEANRASASKLYNLDKHRVYKAKYRSSIKGQNTEAKYKRSEERRLTVKKYNQTDKHRAAVRSIDRKRRTAYSEPYTESQVLELYGTNCYLCDLPIDLNNPRGSGKEGWRSSLWIDHFIPVAAGGADTIDNVRPAHGWCNMSKNAKELPWH